MAIPSQQIGWSQKAKLLWQISKQLENLIKVAGNVQLPTTTTTSTTVVPTTTTSTTVVPTTTTTTTNSVPLTTTAGISGIQSIACNGGGFNITVTFSDSDICNSSTVTNTNGDFVGFTDIWLAVGDQSRLYVNANDVLAVSSTSCVPCPAVTAAFSSIDACAGAVGSVSLIPTYAGPPLLCDCTSFTASNAIALSAGTYFVSNGTFARPFSYPGSGTTLTPVGTCSPC